MRQSLLTLALLTLFCFFEKMQAQGFETGIFFGISHYQGDLQRSHFEVLEAHHANGLFVRYNFNNKIAVRSHFYQGVVSGSDENYPDEPSVRARNLSFRTPLKELGLQFEYTVLAFGETKKHWKKNRIKYKMSSYLFFGMNGFHFNPQAFYKGEWHELQPLGTEGQGLPGFEGKYKRTQIGIPAGFGGKLNITHWSSIGFEIGIRKTFTDHLDDVSGAYPDLNTLSEINPLAAQLSYRMPEYDEKVGNRNPSGSLRGSVAWKDSYVFAGVTASIRLSK